MRITFIRPSMTPGHSRDVLEPMVFAILHALTPTRIERRLYDERLECVPFDEPTDLAVLTVDTYSARRSYQIAALYHQRGIPTVMGGYHPTLCRDEALRFATSVVSGDAESVWPDVLTDAEQGNLARTYEGRKPDLAGVRFDRGLFVGKPYRRVHLVQSGRGCRFACDFCSVHAFYGNGVRHRPVSDVVEELKAAEKRYAYFTDDDLFANAAYADELLTAIRPLRVRWSCQTTLETAANPDLVRRMAESGCLSVTLGFESLQEANLRQMGKAWNRSFGNYEDLIATFRRYRILVYGTFLFGYDHDTPEAFESCVEFAIRSKLFLANINPLTPFPGTPLHERLRREGRLIRDPWWLDPQFRYGGATFHPRGMTAAELTVGCYRARSAFNGLGSLIRRGLDRQANASSPLALGAYLAANLVNRREIHRKQGLPLGDDVPLTPCFDGGAP